MTRSFPGWQRMGLAFVLGLAVALGQAPWGLVPVALIGLVVLMELVKRASSGIAWLAWAAGVGHFGLSLSWIISPFFVEPEVHGWMAPFALVLMAGGMALFWAAAGAATGAVAGLVRYQAICFAVALAGFEALRGVIFTGFPWAMVAHMLVDARQALFASVMGVNGLNLLIFVIIAAFVTFRTIPALLCLTVFTAGGHVALGYLPSTPGPARDVTLRLVQPAIPQSLKWDPDAARANFARLLDMTAQGTPADLTIWPETAVPYLMDTAPEVGQMIAAASGGRPVIVGYQRVEGPQAWNSIGLIGPTGEIAQHYDKAHLVPFGEYIPFGDIAYEWFGLRAFASQVGAGYTAGTGPQVMDLGPALGTILPLICYEAVFPQDVSAAPARADWILQITNDAWFGTLTGPWQHAAQARFRAIEQGLPLVRVGNTGVTAVYDAHGKVIDGHGFTFKNGVGPVGELSLPFGEVAVLDVPFIPGALPPTPYSRWGEWPFLLLLGGCGAALVLGRKRLPA